jgi:hypothetical protein
MVRAIRLGEVCRLAIYTERAFSDPTHGLAFHNSRNNNETTQCFSPPRSSILDFI